MFKILIARTFINKANTNTLFPRSRKFVLEMRACSSMNSWHHHNVSGHRTAFANRYPLHTLYCVWRQHHIHARIQKFVYAFKAVLSTAITHTKKLRHEAFLIVTENSHHRFPHLLLFGCAVNFFGGCNSFTFIMTTKKFVVKNVFMFFVMFTCYMCYVFCIHCCYRQWVPCLFFSAFPSFPKHFSLYLYT